MNLDGPVVTVERAAELMHCSRSKVFELLGGGTLKRAQSFGRKTLVVTESIYEALKVMPAAVVSLPPITRAGRAELAGLNVRAKLAASRAERRRG